MRTKMNFKAMKSNLLIVVLVLIASPALIAQNKNPIELKDFKLIVEKTAIGIKIHSVEGSAWVNLAFSLKNNKTQAVDEFGMTQLGKISYQKDPDFADFLFTITKTKQGLVLKGIEGTAWTDLSFSLAENQQQAIDQFGMTKLK